MLFRSGQQACNPPLELSALVNESIFFFAFLSRFFWYRIVKVVYCSIPACANAAVSSVRPTESVSESFEVPPVLLADLYKQVLWDLKWPAVFWTFKMWIFYLCACLRRCETQK